MFKEFQEKHKKELWADSILLRYCQTLNPLAIQYLTIGRRHWLSLLANVCLRFEQYPPYENCFVPRFVTGSEFINIFMSYSMK